MRCRPGRTRRAFRRRPALAARSLPAGRPRMPSAWVSSTTRCPPDRRRDPCEVRQRCEPPASRTEAVGNHDRPQAGAERAARLPCQRGRVVMRIGLDMACRRAAPPPRPIARSDTALASISSARSPVPATALKQVAEQMQRRREQQARLCAGQLAQARPRARRPRPAPAVPPGRPERQRLPWGERDARVA